MRRRGVIDGGDPFDAAEALEIERVNHDPLRDVFVFAATNHRMFTTGGERSIVNIC